MKESPEIAAMTPLQLSIAERGLLDQSAIWHLPTGCGKTWLAGCAIRRALSRGRRAAYLCPLRSLARELAADWARWPEAQHCGIAAFTGELGADDDTTPSSPREVGLGIYTAEKFDAYLRSWQSNLDWLADIDLLVVDELHLLGSGRRGATLEGVVARFRLINPYAAVIGMSATMGNTAELAQWLGAGVATSDERPVPLHWRIVPFVANSSAQQSKADAIAEEVSSTVHAGGQVIVFCQSRPRTETLASMLRDLGFRAEAHHAGRARQARVSAETAFYQRQLDVLVSTPTLAMGVNLPARKVIVADLQRFDHGSWVDLPVNEVWQLAGRAGRRGLDEYGEVVLLAPKHNQTVARGYLRGKFEPIRSQWIARPHLTEQVLALVGSGIARTVNQAKRAMADTLYIHQSAGLADGTEQAIATMIQAGMLTDDDGRLRATKLGAVAVRHQLTPETVMTWKQFLCLHGSDMTFLDALTLVAASGDFNGRLRATFEEVDDLAVMLNVEPSLLHALPVATWPDEFGQASGRELVCAIKTALALRVWTRLGDLDDAAEMFGLDSYALDEARKEAVRMLIALRATVSCTSTSNPSPVLSPDEVTGAERLRAITTMVATGLNEQAATLALVDGIGPVFARKLLAAGLEDIEDLAVADPNDLSAIGGISPARALKWVESASSMLACGGAYRYRETGVDGFLLAGRPNIDFYRWRRAAALSVVRDGQEWCVTGGAAAHRVDAGGTHCDCLDTARGYRCKHRIAVGHALGDPTIPRFDAPWTENAPATLADLWNITPLRAAGWR